MKIGVWRPIRPSNQFSRYNLFDELMSILIRVITFKSAQYTKRQCFTY